MRKLWERTHGKPVEEVLGKKDFKNFAEVVDFLNYVIKENYPADDVKYWLDGVCAWKKKLGEVVK